MVKDLYVKAQLSVMHAHNQWHESCEVSANSSEFKSSKYFYLAGKSGLKSASYFHK